MTKDLDETPDSGISLSDRDALGVSRMFLKRWCELILQEIDKDIAAIREDAPLDSLIARAKWQKQVDLIFEAPRVFENRYGSPKGKLQLVDELFGDQIATTPLIDASDVERRLEWYKRRAAKDYEKSVRETIADFSIKSPIEQIFVLEWFYSRLIDKFEVGLRPQYETTIDGQKYIIDFLVSHPSGGPKIAIELDGHDFHERTRKQVSRDKTRERALIRNGFIVLRFSGSEITRNPFKCMNEVTEVIQANFASR